MQPNILLLSNVIPILINPMTGFLGHPNAMDIRSLNLPTTNLYPLLLDHWQHRDIHNHRFSVFGLGHPAFDLAQPRIKYWQFLADRVKGGGQLLAGGSADY
jgi:hypothetical protein